MRQNKKILFTWTGLQYPGVSVSGEMHAKTIDQVRKMLQDSNIIPTRIVKKRQFLGHLKAQQSSSTVALLVLKQLSILINANVSLLNALTLIQKAFPHCLVDLLRNDIGAGLSLADTVRKYPRYFSSTTCSLITVAENAGSLGNMLSNIVAYHEQIENVRKQVKKALAYPTFLLFFAVLLSIGMLIFVLPTFQRLFIEYHTELPPLTQTIIHLSNNIQRYWLQTVIWLAFISAIGRYFYLNSSQLKTIINIGILQVPGVGRLIKKNITVRLIATMYTTLSAGIPLLESLSLSLKAAEHPLYARQEPLLQHAILDGKPLSIAIQTLQLPDMIVQMIAIGEESGTLLLMLDKSKNILSSELNESISKLYQLLEPMIMIILGLFITVLLLSMYLPIYNLGNII